MSEKYENSLVDSGFEDSKAEDTVRDLHLVFCIEDEEFAINVADVADILQYTKITHVPKTPNYLKGIINNRGDIIPVICVRAKFMKPEKDYNEQLTCIIKVNYEEYTLGLIVDYVKGVEKIPPENITIPPHTKLNYQNQFIKNIGKTETGIKMILNLEKLIF